MIGGTEGAGAADVRRGMQRQLAARARALGAGSRHRGWKVALTTPQSRAAAGVDRSVVGWLAAESECADGAVIAVDGWYAPTAEAELALHIGAGGGIAAVAAAIEVVDVDRPLHEREAVVAGSIFHRAYLVGPARPGAGVADVAIRALVDGEIVAEQADPCSVIGAPADVLAGVRAELARHGLDVAPGDVILAGSAIPLQPVAAGQRLRVEAGPLGALEVAFSGRGARAPGR